MIKLEKVALSIGVVAGIAIVLALALAPSVASAQDKRAFTTPPINQPVPSAFESYTLQGPSGPEQYLCWFVLNQAGRPVGAGNCMPVGEVFGLIEAEANRFQRATSI